jgi:hypothetical protein
MITALALALTAVATPTPQAVDSFSHAQHRRLFASCDPCHGGIATGDAARTMPSPDLCRNCHDGQTQRLISYTPPTPQVGLLRFTHPDHSRRARAHGDTTITCRTCHALAGLEAATMHVGRATPAACLSCHEHQAPSHLDQPRCLSCHRPLAQATGLTAAAIGRFPKPPSHDSQFVFRHGVDAGSRSCQVCHARDFCSSCHVNARQVAAIAALPADERVAELARGRTVTYPVPASHREGEFQRAHGLQARRTPQPCGSCHARESCLACHRAEDRVPVVDQLPRRQRGGPQGVQLADRRPADHVPGFLQEHRVAAAGGDASCQRCHTPRYCASCHDGAASPAFHGPDFVNRHSQAAFTQDGECASCHQPQAFCQACHQQLGLRPSTTVQSGANNFHTKNPYWRLGHGAVARRSLESCASCHTQSSCLSCHSARGGWRVNPHGPGFEAELGSKNPAMCRFCHTTVPGQ